MVDAPVQDASRRMHDTLTESRVQNKLPRHGSFWTGPFEAKITLYYNRLQHRTMESSDIVYYLRAMRKSALWLLA